MIPISKLMTKEVVAIKKNMHINQAMELLIGNRISGMPVVDDDHRVVGILTEKDMLGCALTCNIKESDQVVKFMSPNVKCYEESDNAIDLCKFLIDNPVRRVPITRDGKLIGIVSRRDILVFILDACSKISDNRMH